MRAVLPAMLLTFLTLGALPSSAQSLSGGGSGGGGIQGGEGAPGGGTGLPGAVANGTTKYGIGTHASHGRRFQNHYHLRPRR
jgi:hypothetical protein